MVHTLVLRVDAQQKAAIEAAVHEKVCEVRILGIKRQMLNVHKTSCDRYDIRIVLTPDGAGAGLHFLAGIQKVSENPIVILENSNPLSRGD